MKFAVKSLLVASLALASAQALSHSHESALTSAVQSSERDAKNSARDHIATLLKPLSSLV